MDARTRLEALKLKLKAAIQVYQQMQITYAHKLTQLQGAARNKKNRNNRNKRKSGVKNNRSLTDQIKLQTQQVQQSQAAIRTTQQCITELEQQVLEAQREVDATTTLSAPTLSSCSQTTLIRSTAERVTTTGSTQLSEQAQLEAKKALASQAATARAHEQAKAKLVAKLQQEYDATKKDPEPSANQATSQATSLFQPKTPSRLTRLIARHASKITVSGIVGVGFGIILVVLMAAFPPAGLTAAALLGGLITGAALIGLGLGFVMAARYSIKKISKVYPSRSTPAVNDNAGETLQKAQALEQAKAELNAAKEAAKKADEEMEALIQVQPVQPDETRPENNQDKQRPISPTRSSTATVLASPLTRPTPTIDSSATTREDDMNAIEKVEEIDLNALTQPPSSATANTVTRLQ
jgi:hypothetical protein